jgi:hypothetical protein
MPLYLQQLAAFAAAPCRFSFSALPLFLQRLAAFSSAVYIAALQKCMVHCSVSVF